MTRSLLLTASDLKQDFVIEAQSELGHPRQDHFELDAAHYLAAQDAAAGADLQTKRAKPSNQARAAAVTSGEERWSLFGTLSCGCTVITTQTRNIYVV